MVYQLSVVELKARLDRTPEDVHILDVREAWETKLCKLPNTIHIPIGQVLFRLHELDRDKPLVVLCHHGIRSFQVAHLLIREGFTELYNLQGGIEAWAREIEPHMSTY